MLRTERLLVRPIRAADLDVFAATVADAETMRFIGDGLPASRDEAAQALARYEQRWREDGIGHFAVVRKDDERFVGRVGILFWDTETWTPCARGEGAQMELGWLLAREHRGNGYATEAARAVRAYVVRTLSPPSLVSLIHVENAASQAVARRLGAVRGDHIRTRTGPADVWVHTR